MTRRRSAKAGPARPALRECRRSELALLDDGPRTATVVANGPLVALSIARAGFRKLLRSEPSIALAVAEELARRLRTAQTIA